MSAPRRGDDAGGSGGRPEAAWVAVDEYLAGRLLSPDETLRAALEASAAGGLPAIQVSDLQGQLLHLLARMAGARRILEIGTLGGYSTIWLARALPHGGRLVSLERSAHHAEVARANLERAGMADRVEVVVGPALETLPTLARHEDGPFDFVFIDADKGSNAKYLRHALDLTRPGAVVVVDNVVRHGTVADADSDEPDVVGTRAMLDLAGATDALDATVVQTVGVKGWDGFLLGVVR